MIYDSVADYSNPKNHVTGLIELDKFSALTNGQARIFAKMAPGGNIKKIPAAYMIKKAKWDGRLAKVHTIVEASSGNMACALCTFAHQEGKNFIAVIRNDTALGKKHELNMLNARLAYENDLSGISPIEYARALGNQEGYLNFCQYENSDNAEAYATLLGPQISSQLKEKHLCNGPLVFCAGVGTGGTILGCGRGLMARHADCRVIGITLAPGERVPGVRDPQRLLEVKTGWQDVIDGDPIQINRYESYRRSLELVKMGLDAGPSSGLALAGVIEYLKTRETRKGVVVVFICPDSYKSYTDKYETILDGPEFARKVPFGI